MNRREIDELLEKARRSLAATERLLADGDSDFAVSRAYYAMFYVARALLLTRDIRRSKHSRRHCRFQRAVCQGRNRPAPSFHLIERCVRRPRGGRLWPRRRFSGAGAFRNRCSSRLCR